MHFSSFKAFITKLPAFHRDILRPFKKPKEISSQSSDIAHWNMYTWRPIERTALAWNINVTLFIHCFFQLGKKCTQLKKNPSFMGNFAEQMPESFTDTSNLYPHIIICLLCGSISRFASYLANLNSVHISHSKSDNQLIISFSVTRQKFLLLCYQISMLWTFSCQT